MSAESDIRELKRRVSALEAHLRDAKEDLGETKQELGKAKDDLEKLKDDKAPKA